MGLVVASDGNEAANMTVWDWSWLLTGTMQPTLLYGAGRGFRREPCSQHDCVEPAVAPDGSLAKEELGWGEGGGNFFFM